MSKELKAPDKVTQKMTRDGAVAENLTTGETSSISERPQEENYSAPAGVAAEKVVQHIGAEIERHAAKGAEKKALDATQPKTHSSRLQFSEAERATPELQKAIKKSDKAADCLDAARAAIPKQTKIKKERVFDEAKGKAKTRLSFEKTDKPPNGKLRHNPLSRPAQELNSTVHGKIYEVEKENVGVESGHRVELAGEKAGGMAARAVKGGIRRHKLKPYRAAAAAEKQAVKANADFLYQKALHDNPALAHSNPISRFWQKQRIKKQYAKTLKAGGKAKKTAEATAKAAKKTAQETKRATFFVVRHWKGCLIVGGIAFIVLLLFGGLSSCSLFGGNSGSGLIASSYLSEDADITGAESAYAAMEAELQDMLDNIESEYPGYDEYRVNADEIEHDPYVLISILSALHEGVFTLDEAQSTLEMLFEKQYILTVEEEVQVRYRTETRTDSEGNEYEVEVPYNYYILHVDLENFNLSHVPVYIMGEEQLSMYAMYMSSLGNRPDLFPSSGYVSKYYENPPADYEVPAALLNSFSSLIVPEVAERHVRERSVAHLIERMFSLNLFCSLGICGALFAFANEIGAALSPNPDVGVYIRLLAPVIPIMYLDTAVDCMLKGMDEQLSVMRYNVVDAALSMALVYILLPIMGIKGYILVICLSEVFNFSLSLGRLIKVTKFELDLTERVVKPILCIAISVLATKIMSHAGLFSDATVLLGACAPVAAAAVLYLLLARLCGIDPRRI